MLPTPFIVYVSSGRATEYIYISASLRQGATKLNNEMNKSKTTNRVTTALIIVIMISAFTIDSLPIADSYSGMARYVPPVWCSRRRRRRHQSTTSHNNQQYAYIRSPHRIVGVVVVVLFRLRTNQLFCLFVFFFFTFLRLNITLIYFFFCFVLLLWRNIHGESVNNCIVG